MNDVCCVVISTQVCYVSLMFAYQGCAAKTVHATSFTAASLKPESTQICLVVCSLTKMNCSILIMWHFIDPFPYSSDETTRTDLKKLPTLPTKVLKEHPSLAYWYCGCPTPQMADWRETEKNYGIDSSRHSSHFMALSSCLEVTVCDLSIFSGTVCWDTYSRHYSGKQTSLTGLAPAGWVVYY